MICDGLLSKRDSGYSGFNGVALKIDFGVCLDDELARPDYVI